MIHPAISTRLDAGRVEQQDVGVVKLPLVILAEARVALIAPRTARRALEVAAVRYGGWGLSASPFSEFIFFLSEIILMGGGVDVVPTSLIAARNAEDGDDDNDQEEEGNENAESCSEH